MHYDPSSSLLRPTKKLRINVIQDGGYFLEMVHTQAYPPHLPEGLQEVGAHCGYHQVNVVDDEERLVQHLVGEVGEVVCYVEQFLQGRPLRERRTVSGFGKEISSVD